MPEKTEDDLHELVISLTKPEKRYVSIFAAKHIQGGNNNYLKLFDELAKMPEFDEKKLKKKLGKQRLKGLPAEKNYLYRFVLKAMRSYQGDTDINITIAEQMLSARFLFNKGLYPQCYKMLKKTRQAAAHYELFYELGNIIQLEKWLVYDKLNIIEEGWLNEIHRLEDMLQESYNLMHKFGRMRDELLAFIRPGIYTNDDDKLQKARTVIGKDEYLENRSHLPNFRVKSQYFNTLILYFTIIKDWEMLDNVYNDVLKLWECNNQMIDSEPGEYRRILANYLTFCHNSGKFYQFENILDIIKKLPANTIDDRASLFKNVYFLEILYYMNCGRLHEACAMIAETAKGLETYKKHINDSRLLSFYYNFSVTLFFCSRYAEAGVWVNRIVNIPKTEMRRDIRDFARLLQVILQYEQGEYELAEYMGRSCSRYLARIPGPHVFEREVLACLRKINWSAEYSTIKGPINHFIEALEKMQRDFGIYNVVGLQEIYCWAKSKIGQIPLEQMYHVLHKVESEPNI